MLSKKLAARLGLVKGEEPYLSMTFARLRQYGTPTEKKAVLGGWLLSLVASIAFGLLVVVEGWSGLPLPFGGIEVFITIYPPLLICLWWTLCFGWLWGAIPAYIATLVLALYSGMPLDWALLFSFADPLGFAAVSIGYRAIRIPRDLRSIQSLAFFVLINFIGAIFSSAGALIWCYTNQVDTLGLLPIWQGWWLGAFLQSMFIVGPILFLTHPFMARWQAERSILRAPEVEDLSRRVLRLVMVLVLGVLGYGFLTIKLGVERVETALSGVSDSPLMNATEVLTSTVWIFFWVVALIVLSIGVFNYRIFTRWESLVDALMAELTRLAQTDHLTGLPNRRSMAEVLETQFHRFSRYGESGALLMVDLDYFKEINDRYGHAAGDQVIKCFADAVRSAIRLEDTASRWGGEEFLILLPRVNQEGAHALAERLRGLVQDDAVDYQGQTIHYTVSIGIALHEDEGATLDDWISLADDALYTAKQQGRNQVVALENRGGNSAADREDSVSVG
ncbi:diguanylate cyclase [Marinobacterium sp. D7]|uniref:sensor domain-containing diguanylate cyclase n=1 Tax=Marinobacterium ramblicola TaxID=2849041 RepID=UPI001C2D7967|nr:diguanylate cyclase [Marinobacterium ramblicola]MBV1787144.1 diguanylate cyclase [Marinobacterium ramblicola]